MKHELRVYGFGVSRVPITAAEYQGIKVASATIVEAIEFEELFDALIENYRDLEVGVFQRGVSSFLQLDRDWSDMHDQRNGASRLVGNLLTTCRLYLDCLPPQLGRIGGSVIKRQAKGWRVAEANSSDEFRFMEIVRNHAQHSGSVVHSLVSKWRQRPDHVEHGMGLAIDIGTLSDRNLRPNEKKALTVIAAPIRKAYGDNPDLMPILRKYLDCIERLHSSARRSVSSIVGSSESVIENAIKNYEKVTGVKNPLGLSAVVTDGRVFKEHVSLLEEMVQRRRLLERRHPSGRTLSGKVTSNASW